MTLILLVVLGWTAFVLTLYTSVGYWMEHTERKALEGRDEW